MAGDELILLSVQKCGKKIYTPCGFHYSSAEAKALIPRLKTCGSVMRSAATRFPPPHAVGVLARKLLWYQEDIGTTRNNWQSLF